jgi:hypothetical protein
MDTSTSAGIQCVPFSDPVFNKFSIPAFPANSVSGVMVFQLVSPATPRSFPTHRTPGPASLKKYYFGLKLPNTVFNVAGQS